MLVDIHSHKKDCRAPEIRISNLEPDENIPIKQENRGELFFSTGIHPWRADEFDRLKAFFERKLAFESLIMVGEIGLDKVCKVPLEMQLDVLNYQAGIADDLSMPVVIHVVKAMSELLKVRKRYGNIPLWIIHGFRGGKVEAEQYLSKGFSLSYGKYHNIHGLLACPIDRMFLETDDSDSDIEDIYSLIADERSIGVENLEKSIEANFRREFNNIQKNRKRPFSL